MNKKLVSLVLSGLIVLNSTGSLETVYADNNNQSKELTKNEDTKSTQVVYLEKGEGDRNVGDGTKNSPYQNIRTALEKIQNGGTLKLVGNVVYTKYDKDNEGAALPLTINKNITIEGDGKSGLYLRAPIQLGADVTFKNIRLEMVPAVLLGRMLGQVIERSTTIFVAGHELTLDNVNTRVGTSASQYNARPYISGGTYKNEPIYKKEGDSKAKSKINIVNPNSETKLSGIYAGDYYKDLDLDVEINIDGNVVLDNKIYAGGHNHNLNGDVTVNLGEGSNITKFDKANHNGKIDVKLNNSAYIVNFDAKNINDLTLEEESKIILSNDATFNVDNVVLKNDATIDFRDMTNNTPTVKNNFEGETTVNSSRKGGTIFLNNEQTLDVQGTLSGTTRLNNRGSEPVHRFLDDHIYVTADSNSSGELSIADSMFDNYELNAVKDSNRINWTINRLQEGFGDFKWVGEDNRIRPKGNGTIFGEGLFEIEFTNDEGQVYTPADDLYTDFEYTLTKLDENGNEEEVIDYNAEDNIGIDKDDNVEFYLGGDGVNTEIVVWLDDIDSLKNDKMILKVTHKKTQKSIEKNIYLVKDEKQLKGTVNIVGSPIEGRIISADISGLPKDVEDIKYKWYVIDKSGQKELIKDEIGKGLVLKNEYVDKTIKVEVEAMNYLGTVSSNEVVVKSKDVAPVINGIQNTEIKAGDVDKFNAGENLKGITARDYKGNPITNIDVIGKVEKPEAGTNRTFQINYSVTDNDGNITDEIREVTVTNQKPTISGLTDIVINQGENYNVKTGVTSEDHEDKTISNIEYPKDDLTKLDIGVHKIKYSVTDSDNNTVEEERTVVVNKKASLIGPKIQGIGDIELKVSQVDEFNDNHRLTGVTASDDIDTDVKVSVSGKAEKPLGGTDGTYELTYTAIDSDLNETIEKRTVTVTNRKPVISGLSEITITKGETADIIIGVAANDYEDGQITNIAYPTTDLTKLDVGTHKIIYSVTDSDGNTVQSERKVVILEKVEEKPEIPEIPDTEGSTPDVEQKPETPDTEDSTPDVEQKPETPDTEDSTPDVEQKPETPDTEDSTPDAEQKPELPDAEENKPDVEEKPELPDAEENKPDVEEKPELPDTEESAPEDTLKPEQSIIEDISKIEGIKIESGNATIESPVSIKVDTLSGLTNLLDYYTSNNFNIDSVESAKEEGNFLVYLVKITKNTITKSTETYFMEVKVAKDNQEVIDTLESIVDKDNTNNETNNDVTLDEEANNDSSNNNSNSNDSNDIDNNVSNDNNVENNSNEANKEETPKTYDGGIGSYILSGIGSIGLLSILNKKKKRKK